MTLALRTALRGSRSLTLLAGVMTGLLLVSVVGLIADDRTLGGQPVWLKPAKFAISILFYGITLAWLMAHLRRGRRTAAWAATIITALLYVEIGVIVTQVIRGRASHFNVATPLDEALWRTMAVSIVVLWLATAAITLLLWRDGMPDRAGTWSVRLGMVLLLAGLAQGFLMAVPTATQLELGEQGLATAMGAHAVGVPDGGPGMPLTGWSTTGGDLRVGHFVGIHALQAILLFAMVLPGLVTDAVRRIRLVFVFAFAYAGLLVLVTWQALRGQPLTAPDDTTLTALAVLAAATVLASVISWLRPVPAAH